MNRNGFWSPQKKPGRGHAMPLPTGISLREVTKPAMVRPSSLMKFPMPYLSFGGIRRTAPKSRLHTMGSPSMMPVMARPPGAMALIRPSPSIGSISRTNPCPAPRPSAEHSRSMNTGSTAKHTNLRQMRCGKTRFTVHASGKGSYGKAAFPCGQARPTADENASAAGPGNAQKSTEASRARPCPDMPEPFPFNVQETAPSGNTRGKTGGASAGKRGTDLPPSAFHALRRLFPSPCGRSCLRERGDKRRTGQRGGKARLRHVPQRVSPLRSFPFPHLKNAPPQANFRAPCGGRRGMRSAPVQERTPFRAVNTRPELSALSTSPTHHTGTSL